METKTQQEQSVVELDPSMDVALYNLLLQSMILTEDLAQGLLERSKGDQGVFEHFLLQEGYLIDQQLGKLKAQAHGWHYVNLDAEVLEESVLDGMPRAFAEAQKVIPFLHKEGESISVAMNDPSQGKIVRLLKKKYGKDCKVYYATDSAIGSALSHYGTGYKERTEDILVRHEEAELREDTDDASIVELVDTGYTPWSVEVLAFEHLQRDQSTQS